MRVLDDQARARALGLRGEFPILREKVYLISASLGPLSIRSRRYLEGFLDLWASTGSPEVVWFENVFPVYDRIKALVASLVGAIPAEVSLQANISTAISSVASFFDYSERPKVVVGALDFPTGHHVWHAQQRRGAEVVVVPSRDGITVETEDYLSAIDRKTALVQVNRVLYQSSAILDLPAIADAAHDAGALVLVDDFHGCGVVPIDVWSAGADFYAAGVLKWLCGGGGLSFLLVRKDLIPRLRSQVTGWWANKPESYFSTETDLAEDARRFETGTTAPPVAYLALGGLEIITEAGIDAIRELQKELTSYIVERADAEGLRIASPRSPEARGGLVRILLDDSEQVFRRLLEMDVVVDERAGGLRVAPHFFNTRQEIEGFFEALGRARTTS